MKFILTFCALFPPRLLRAFARMTSEMPRDSYEQRNLVAVGQHNNNFKLLQPNCIMVYYRSCKWGDLYTSVQ